MVDKELYLEAEKIVKLLKARSLKVATAESCTGGLVSALITSVAGVSDVFEMGLASYSCRIKNEVLGVSAKTLERFGAISENTAREMAVNIRKKAGADFGLSVTGAAGPDGSEGHPPGCVFIAVAHKDGVTVKKLDVEPLSRGFVRATAARELFSLLTTLIKDSEK